MMQGQLAEALARLGVGTTLLLATPGFSPDITVPYIGVPFNVVFSCAAGTFAAFGIAGGVKPRGRMFRQFGTCLIMGCAFTALTTAAIQAWARHKGVDVGLSDGVKAALGAVVSCLTHFALPPLTANIESGKWVNWVPFLRRYINTKTGE